jgi:hypothetical protein
MTGQSHDLATSRRVVSWRRIPVLPQNTAPENAAILATKSQHQGTAHMLPRKQSTSGAAAHSTPPTAHHHNQPQYTASNMAPPSKDNPHHNQPYTTSPASQPVHMATDEPRMCARTCVWHACPPFLLIPRRTTKTNKPNLHQKTNRNPWTQRTLPIREGLAERVVSDSANRTNTNSDCAGHGPN